MRMQRINSYICNISIKFVDLCYVKTMPNLQKRVGNNGNAEAS